MPTRELLAPSQRAQLTDFTAPLDDRTLARCYTLSDNELDLIRRRHRRASREMHARLVEWGRRRERRAHPLFPDGW